MPKEQITENIRRLRDEIPAGVKLEAAAKTRTAEEVAAALEAGVDIIGENYVQEAVDVESTVRDRAPLHFIGHLQRNKVRQAVQLFDLIETLDSYRLAEEIDKRSAAEGKIMEVMVEVNSGREEQKFGIFPEEVENFLRRISSLLHIHVRGLMTMGPFSGDPEEARPYFRETRKCLERCRGLDLPNVTLEELSMGMTNSYRVAIEEGATIIRVGTLIFGPR